MSPIPSQPKGVLNQDVSFGGVTLVQKTLLAKHLAVMLSSGLTLGEALETAGETAKGKLARVLEQVRRRVLAGASLSAALAEHPRVFPPLFINAVFAGESSGNLAGNLANIAEQLEKDRVLISKIKGAMMYPAIILVAAFGLGLMLAFVLLPKLTPLFSGLKMELPWTTRALIAFGAFIENDGWQFLIGLVAAIIILIWLGRRKFTEALRHWVLLKLPGIGPVVRSANLSRFAGSLGLLLKSGVNLDEALEVTERTLGNYYYRRALRRAAHSTIQGTKLSDSLSESTKLFPPLVTRLVRVGEVSGKFEETLFFLSDFYEGEVDRATKNLSTALEPLLLLGIGLVVAGLALSIITPIYQITGNIGR